MMPVDRDWVKSIRAQDVEEVSVPTFVPSTSPPGTSEQRWTQDVEEVSASLFISSTRPLGISELGTSKLRTSELGTSELGMSEQCWAQDVEEVANSTYVPSTRSLGTSERRCWTQNIEEVSDLTSVPNSRFFGTPESVQDAEEISYFQYVPKNLEDAEHTVGGVIIPERCDKPDAAFTNAADWRDGNSANKEEFAENNSSLNVNEDFAESNSLSNVGVIQRDSKVPNKKEATTIAPLSYATLIHTADQRAENSGIKKESAVNNSPILPNNDSSNADTWQVTK
jgi:hypothetical protein